VDEDRDPPVSCELEDRLEPLVVEEEALGPRVELDAARSEVDAPARLIDGMLGEVEASERNQKPVRLLGRLERPVVRGPKTRVAVGLIHAEAVGSDRAGVAKEREELVERRDEAVDVPAAVDVRVEDLGSRRDRSLELRRVGEDELIGPFERILHGSDDTV
jgi:hypothetical protein